MNYKNAIIAIILFCGVGAIVPQIAHAAPPSGRQAIPQCEALQSKLDKTQSLIEKNMNTVKDRRNSTMANFEKEIILISNKVTTFQKKTTTQLLTALKNLDVKAKTAEQRTANNVYAASVKSALEERRVAYQQIHDTSTASIKEAISTYRNRLDSGVQSARSNLNQTAQNAILLCYTRGVSEAKKTIRPSVESIRSQFIAEDYSINSLTTSILAIQDTRRQALKEAQALFKQKIENTRKILSEAYGKDKALILGRQE